MKKAGYLLLMMVILFVSGCGVKSSKVKFLRHSPVQNPDGIYFEDDPDFVKYYSAYLKKMAKAHKETQLEDPMYSIESVDSLKGAEVIDDDSSGWNVDTIDSNVKYLRKQSEKKVPLKNEIFSTKNAPVKSSKTLLKKNTEYVDPKLKSGNEKYVINDKKHPWRTFILAKDKAVKEDKNAHFLKKEKSIEKDAKPSKKAGFFTKTKSHKVGIEKSDNVHNFQKKEHKVVLTKQHVGNNSLVQGELLQKQSGPIHSVDSTMGVNSVKKVTPNIKEHIDYQKSSIKMELNDQKDNDQKDQGGCSIEHYLTAKANRNLYIKPNAESKAIILPKIKKELYQN